MNIDEMKARLVELQKQIHALSQERMELQNMLAEARSEFRIGDVIEFQYGKGLARGVVEKILPWGDTNSTLVVTTIRKDGSKGAHQTVYPYKKPVKVQQ